MNSVWIKSIFEVEESDVAKHDQISGPFVASKKTFLKHFKVPTGQSIYKIVQLTCLQQILLGLT